MNEVVTKRSWRLLDHLGALAIATAILVVGLGWLALEVKEASIAGRLGQRGVSYLSDTHYWDDGSIKVDWKWRRTEVVKKKEALFSLTLCLVSATVTNLHSSQQVAITRLILILQDKWGFELHEKEHEVEWIDHSKQLKWAKDNRLKAGESREVSFKMMVPTGLLPDVHTLSARLGFSRKGPEEE